MAAGKATASTPATAPATAPAAEVQTPAPADPRAAALAALTGGAADAPAPAETEAPAAPVQVEDFGGDTLAVVLSSRYNGKMRGEFVQVRKGAVVKVTAAKLKRGIATGVLRKHGK